MWCSKCGNTLSNGALFCTVCGTKVERTSNIVQDPRQIGLAQKKNEVYAHSSSNYPSQSNDNVSQTIPQTTVNNSENYVPEREEKIDYSVYSEETITGVNPSETYEEKAQKKKISKSVVALVIVSVVLVITLLLGTIVVYYGYVNPVSRRSFLGKIFTSVGIGNFDRSYSDDNNDNENTDNEVNDKEYKAESDKNDESEYEEKDKGGKSKTDKSAKNKEHKYHIVKSDITWSSAKYEAGRYGKNTYLASINSEEEFNKITQLAYEQGIRVLWLGASRTSSEAWYKVNWLDGSDFNSYGLWLPGEPSYTDAEGYDECYLEAIYISGNPNYEEGWYLNDVPNDISMYNGGKIGYAIEEEE